MHKLIFLFVFLLILTGCASKRYVKKAMELENSGLYSSAADQYYNSLTKNINNIDAQIGLQRTGQLVLDDYIDKFKSQYQNGTAKEAVYAFKNAENYYQKLQKVGMNLIFPEEQSVYYQEMEDTYLSKLYQEGSKALSLEEFESSEPIFAEILTLNESYKDARSKWVIAKYEPIYRAGNQLMSSQMYRSSYLSFKKIVDEVGTYENSIDLMNETLDKAKVTILIPDVSYRNEAYQTLAVKLKSKVVNGINNMNNPLYEVVSAVENDKNLFTQRYGAFANNTGYDAQVDAKAVLQAKVINYGIHSSRLIKNEKRGYLKNTVEYEDAVTHETKKKTVYDKVIYYEYEMERSVSVTVEYAMNRKDRDELAVSNVFDKQETDRIYYATYEGDYRKLVPGYWKYANKESSEDYINKNSAEVNDLRALMKERKTVKSIHELEMSLIDGCVELITSDISNYTPEN